VHVCLFKFFLCWNSSFLIFALCSAACCPSLLSLASSLYTSLLHPFSLSFFIRRATALAAVLELDSRHAHRNEQRALSLIAAADAEAETRWAKRVARAEGEAKRAEIELVRW
jgi:hypothetical protein